MFDYIGYLGILETLIDIAKVFTWKSLIVVY